MKKILVIDDNKELRENLSELLENSGYIVTTAGNGLEAIGKLTEEIPNLVLCDIMMPLMDGLEFYTIVKEQEYMINVPFLFLTAKSDVDTMDFAMTLGADDFIAKPFKATDLLKRIESRLEKKEKLEKKINKLKKDISLYVPHELKTPIFPIIGYSEMILSDLDELSKFELKDMVKGILNSAIRLKERMEKFNAYAEYRMQREEKFSENKSDYDQKTTIDEELVSEFAKKSNDCLKKENLITYDIEKEEIKIAIIDFEIIVRELIENACKFSEVNTQVKIIGKRHGDKYNLLINNQGEAFEIKSLSGFTQQDRRKNQQIGNGLGLAIVNMISQKYDLKILSKYENQNTITVVFNLL